MPDARELRNAAVTYASNGWHVIPLRPGQKPPAGRVVPNGLSQATDDIVTVLRWWQPSLALSPYNIGLVCNPSGLVALDVDPRHDGDETLAEMERKLGKLPQTVESETGGGGWHYIFKHPGGTLRGQMGPGLDVRDHAYIVLPPSTHPNGRTYAWSVDGHPEEVEVVDLPTRWVEELQVSTRRVEQREIKPTTDPLRMIPAATYVPRLTGREVDARGWVQCPLHGGGGERTPSFKVDGAMWACYACPVPPGERCLGGNIIDLQALLMGMPVPVRGADYLEVRAHLKRTFRGS